MAQLGAVRRLTTYGKPEADKSAPGQGRIANIGKFLLDKNDLRRIEKIVSEQQLGTGIRRLTTYGKGWEEPSPLEAGAAKLPKMADEARSKLLKLLKIIKRQPGVIGSCVVKSNAMPLISTLPKKYDPEILGIHSLGIYLQSVKTSNAIGHNELMVIVLRCDSGHVVISNIGSGFLITLTKEEDTSHLIEVLRTQTSLIAQSGPE
jgi:predicted regulator of Ras-like GTPase activity (Roadblock/LC7/MglB family)